MKKRYFTITILLFSITLFAMQGEKIEFFRFAKEGDRLQCRLVAQKSIISKTYFADSAKEVKINSQKEQIALKGNITILSVNKRGYATELKFFIKQAAGKNGEKKYSPSWVSKILLIKLNDKCCKFSLKTKEALSREDIKMLSLLFHPIPKYNIDDYIGTEKEITIGESWDAKSRPFEEFFKLQGIIIKPQNISGKVYLKAKRQFHTVSCWEVEEKLNIVNIPNFQFHFSFYSLIPIRSDIGTMRIDRKVYEKFEKYPNSKNFMTTGIKKITLEMSNSMSGEMIPLSIK